MDIKERTSLGGKTRMASMDPVDRYNFAKRGSDALHSLPKAEYKGELFIDDLILPCAVLTNGKRVLSELGILSAFGSKKSSGAANRNRKKSIKEGTAPLPVFLANNQVKPFAINKLETSPLFKPISYKIGRNVVIGYDANILAEICEIWIDAKNAGALLKNQFDKANKAEILLVALAKIGIIALIDEATGYQEVRERQELHKLLSKYLSEERLEWSKMFPDEFYKQIYRLKKWTYPRGNGKTPLLGKITNDVVYKQLPEGVLEELKKRNPIRITGTGRYYKHHQFLSVDVGQPDLRNHLIQLITIMKLSNSWEEFEKNFNKIFERPSDETGV